MVPIMVPYHQENDMTTMALVQAVHEFDESTGNLADDLREHDVQDLRNKYDLNESEAGMFWLIIREATDPLYCTYGVEEKNGKVFLETIQESIHQSYEGNWPSYDRLVIRAYLADITLAVYLTVDPNLRIPDRRIGF